jgi:hypothetical protein
MSAPPDVLRSILDHAFTSIGQARESFAPQLAAREVGTITSVATGIAKVSGLPGAGFEELLTFPGSLAGIAFNVDEDEIGVVLLGDYSQLHTGDEVERTGRVMDVAVGDALLGRVIDPLGHPLDGLGPVTATARLPIERPSAAITPLVGEIQVKLESSRAGGAYAGIYLFHNRPGPGATYQPSSQRLLPLDEQWRSELIKLRWPTGNLPEIIGGDESTLRALIREYLFVSLFRICAESLASENSSRLVAMQRAEKNIDELLVTLTRNYNRLRQTSIDEELFDVISGFEALSGS